jgi:hypothetical protein
MKDVAGDLRTSPDYVSQRFREALWDAANCYRMGPSSAR